jgi:hypothetical protein
MVYEVIVGNIGYVYKGDDQKIAEEMFDAYCTLSRHSKGRAAGEDVTLMCNGETQAELHSELGMDEVTKWEK